MPAATVTATARRTVVDKHDERRRALADSALRTLGDRGYARTSLREIAHNSEFSHGVVHYYFDDKLDLIVYCVQHYKAACVHRYDGVIAEATTADELVDAFVAKLLETLVEEAPMHRLWYDLRSQSMFEGNLQQAVQVIDRTLEDMVGRVVGRAAELSGTAPALPASTAYALLDGLFQQALLGHLAGSTTALEQLEQQVRHVVPLLLASAPQQR